MFLRSAGIFKLRPVNAQRLLQDFHLRTNLPALQQEVFLRSFNLIFDPLHLSDQLQKFFQLSVQLCAFILEGLRLLFGVRDPSQHGLPRLSNQIPGFDSNIIKWSPIRGGNLRIAGRIAERPHVVFSRSDRDGRLFSGHVVSGAFFPQPPQSLPEFGGFCIKDLRLALDVSKCRRRVPLALSSMLQALPEGNTAQDEFWVPLLHEFSRESRFRILNGRETLARALPHELH
mmetsp:Transcript_55454/g.147968  ORF Transcript_55454/g.147968 Transcript_55454/m.147968 type:complete len:230 (+) Transcript_55454:472-1161(+)